jgi:hypothetical protein
MHRLTHVLSERVDNAPLILFRILFGALMFFEGSGAILTGWAKSTFVDVSFTINFIGFDFLQVLTGPQIYAVYSAIALLGIAIMLGWRYRLATFLFILVWGATYFLQKSHYNNHYYLVWLVGIFLAVVPAHQYRSLDAARQPAIRSTTCANWCLLIFKVQIAIVYFYAAVAKIYPDWLAARPIALIISTMDFETIPWDTAVSETLKGFFSQRPVHYFISYSGIFFDFFIIPAFLWKRTRTIALVASFCFHLANSMIFEIGVFPYFALSFVIFFYPAEKIRSIFFPGKIAVMPESATPIPPPRLSSALMLILAGFFALQVYLPLRHWHIPGNVLWTEEGHRLSWRMMLRTRAGSARISVVNEREGIYDMVDMREYLSPHQVANVTTKPDMMWQFVQILEQDYRQRFEVDDVEIYVNAYVSVNGRKSAAMIDPAIDLSAVKWKRFGHQDWLLPAPF